MLTSFTFFEPHAQARPLKVRRAPLPAAQLSCDAAGRFRFNQAASERLGLYARNARVRFGNAPTAPAEWAVQVVEHGGHLLRDMNPATRSRKAVRGFVNIALRERIMATLSLPATQTITLTLDTLSFLAAGLEAWCLKAAPCPPPPAAKKASLTPVQRLLLPPGLADAVQRGDLALRWQPEPPRPSRPLLGTMPIGP
jgi:hypothetical protein